MLKTKERLKKLKEIEPKIVEEYKSIEERYGVIPSLRSLAEKFKVSTDFVRRVLKENKLPVRGLKERRSFILEATYKLRNDLLNLINPWFQNISRYPKIEMKFPAKIIIVDDEHFPFCDMRAFEEVLRKDGDADGMIMSEILDVQTFSKWPKRYFEDLTYVEKRVKEWMDLLSKKFKRIIVILGNNHHLRIIKFLESLSIDQLEYLKKFFNVYPEFLKEYSNLIPIQNSFVQIGKAVICHFDNYSSVPIKTVKDAYDFIRKHFDVFGLELPDSVWCGHTHCLRMDYSSERVLLAEVGCLTYAQPYLFDRGKISYTKRNRWTLGYGVLYLKKDGSTDYEKSGIKFLGYSEIPPQA